MNDVKTGKKKKKGRTTKSGGRWRRESCGFYGASPFGRRMSLLPPDIWELRVWDEVFDLMADEHPVDRRQLSALVEHGLESGWFEDDAEVGLVLAGQPPRQLKRSETILREWFERPWLIRSQGRSRTVKIRKSGRHFL
jgi:hypothetical protein